MKLLIYDAEIINCVPTNGEQNPNYTYCRGWSDFPNMGISVIGTWRNYNCWNPFGKYEAFTNPASYMTEIAALPQFVKFKAIASQADIIVGFNSLNFDDKLLAANGMNVTTDFDLLAEVRVAAGMPPLSKKYNRYNLTSIQSSPSDPLIKDLIIKICGGMKCNSYNNRAGWRKYVLTSEQYRHYEWLVERPEPKIDEIPF